LERTVSPLELSYDLVVVRAGRPGLAPPGQPADLAGFAGTIGLATTVQAAALTITDALIERFGLFIVIVLDETVTGVVDGLVRAALSPLTLAVGLVVVVCSRFRRRRATRGWNKPGAQML